MRVKMSGFKRLTRVEEALARLLEAIEGYRLAVEEVPVEEAAGRVCAEELKALVDVPPFDRSAVDGYAVRYLDVLSVSESSPVELRVVGVSKTGSRPDTLPEVKSGEAVEIYTGAPMPRGADSVVMVEYTKREGDRLWVYRPVAYMQNVSRRGEDFSAGEPVVSVGVKLRPWHIGALASLGITSVKVYRRPIAAVASTGSELKPLGSKISPGEVIDSTRPMIKAFLRSLGCDVLDLGILEDDPTVISEAVSKGLKHSDLMVLTGGTSLGLKDATPDALSMVEGSRLIFHGVRMRPGKPTGAYLVNGKPVFMLSGFPVAAFVGFMVFVEPAVRSMMRCKPDPQPIVKAYVTRRVAKPPGVRAYVRVRVYPRDGVLYAEPLRLTGSGIISTLTRGNGLLILREEVEGVEEGEEVEVLLTQPVEV